MNMKKILYSLFVSLAFVFASCDESTQDTSKITYFIDLELEGETTMLWPKGTPFADPGYMAILDGEDVTSEVIVSGVLNVNTPGVYTLSYAAVNIDGFANTKQRTIFVYDPTPSTLETGIYTVSKDSYRDRDGAVVTYGKEYTITIFQAEPGKFYTSDFFGGWYDQRAGYGSSYAMNGHFTLKADDTLELVNSHVDGWGDSLNGITGSYDPVTKTITWDASYSGNPVMIFHVVMTKS